MLRHKLLLLLLRATCSRRLKGFAQSGEGSKEKEDEEKKKKADATKAEKVKVAETKVDEAKAEEPKAVESQADPSDLHERGCGLNVATTKATLVP